MWAPVVGDGGAVTGGELRCPDAAVDKARRPARAAWSRAALTLTLTLTLGLTLTLTARRPARATGMRAAGEFLHALRDTAMHAWDTRPGGLICS